MVGAALAQAGRVLHPGTGGEPTRSTLIQSVANRRSSSCSDWWRKFAYIMSLHKQAIIWTYVQFKFDDVSCKLLKIAVM